jgi:hypothetical protein
MKPAGKWKACIILFARIFPLLEDLLQLGEADAIEHRNGKGVRRKGERLPNPPWCLARKAALHGGFRVCL